MTDRIQQQLDFLAEIDKMKSVLRQTLLIDRSRRENDAEHSWHLAMTAMVLAEYAGPTVDLNHVLRMALVHDLVEIDAGDTFAYDTAGYADKDDRERAAADRLFALLPGDQGPMLRALWEEFEAMETPDARYAAACDRLQPLLHTYLTDGHTWTLGGGVTEEQVWQRMAVVEDAVPALWPFVQEVIAWGLRTGKLRPDLEAAQ